MAENIFPSAGRKYDVRISRGASGNSVFITQKMDLYASIYSNVFENVFKNQIFCGNI